jgi:hypothetical protein
MENLRDRLNQRKFAVHLAAFLLIVLPSIGLYFAAGQGMAAAIYILIGLVALGNLLAMSVP